ncbi:MAG: urea carboxylase-associated family protein [Chloroflexota bacterium]|nr:urea carboxylase-associated family protein [Chloroflexota bacterium]
MPNGEDVSFPRLTQLIEARSGTAFELREGERLQLVDQSGKQVAVVVAFKQDDHGEWLSPSHTREGLDAIMLTAGRSLVSNRRNGLLRLEEDTVGRHDLLVPACDQRRYLDYYGLPGHASCRDNLTAALAPYGIPYERIPDPVNIFMHVAILGRGELEFREPLSEPNDYVTFRALADLIVAISACPQDQNATNARNPTDLLVRIYDH